MGRMALAAKVGADGVHIGQSDMGVEKARAILGKEKIIGVTAKTVEQAKAAEAAGADYLGSGAVFGTSTKKGCKTDGSCTFTGDLREREDPGGGNRRH